MEGLHAHLAALLAQIKSDPRIDPALASMAESHSSQLLEGFRATLLAAECSQQQGEASQGVRLRARVKTTPSRAVHAGKLVRRRLIGKQPKKTRTLGDFFRVSDNTVGTTTLGGAQAEADMSDV